MLFDIPADILFENIVKKLTLNRKITNSQKTNIIEASLHYNYHMNLGYRKIFHLEAYMLSLVNILKNDNYTKIC